MILKLPEPQPKQKEFLSASARFVGYGGGRGGGKSWAVRMKALLLALNYPGITILIIRRTMPELRQNHIQPLSLICRGFAEYKSSYRTLFFGNGSKILFGYLRNDSDLLQYQGNEYDIIFIDEATQLPEHHHVTLTACLRGANSFPKRMYFTMNPGGVGHDYMKRLFITKDYKESEDPDDYVFIKALVKDNPALLRNDPGYVKMLENMPPVQREAWLNGDWDVFEGQYFSMWNRDIHVIKPFGLPSHWRRYRTIDYGLDMLACLWVALDEQNNAYVYREVYESGLVVSKAAERIKEYSDEEVFATFAPPDLWNRHADTGRSTADIFAESGIPLTKAKNDRVQGWYDLAEWLKIRKDEQGMETAKLRIMENCKNIIRTLPSLQCDEKHPNDVSREPHELTHAPDALRYFVAGRPIGEPVVDVSKMDELDYDSQVERFLRYGM